MKRYCFPTHRAAFGIAAAAMTAITLGLFVAVPANFDAGDPQAPMFAGEAAPVVVLIPSRIDVVAVRDRTSPVAQVAVIAPTRKLGG